MITAPQRVAKNIGEGGCYFLCLCKLAETLGVSIDVLLWYDVAVKEEFMDRECFLTSPDLLLSRMSGRKFSVRKESASYVCLPGEYEVLRYEIPRVSGHFVLPGFDPYGDSHTLAVGQLASKRIFSEVGV